MPPVFVSSISNGSAADFAAELLFHYNIFFILGSLKEENFKLLNGCLPEQAERYRTDRIYENNNIIKSGLDILSKR